jgi:hypothetical protein
MSTTIHGRFDSGEDARRGAAWLEREGIPRDAITVAERPGAAGERHWTVAVRTSDAAHRRLAADVLRAAGAKDLDQPSPQRPGIGAGSAIGMAIADAATAPMSGVSASRAQGPAEDPLQSSEGDGADEDRDDRQGGRTR